MSPHTFPEDLVTLQRHIHSTYEELAAPRPTAPTLLRRRLQRLTAQLITHPYWATIPSARTARVELRRQARKE
ncbi:hypothetical protein [Streptomyces sp. NPDC050738]|uniref:hypothetical protein n=1 Tax=Streptomyces sp. NPDC050738 TaxID=3154744 RepID=UPI0034184795